jgi:HSP20 family protein
MARKTKIASSRPRPNPFRGFVDLMSEMNRAQSQWMRHAQGGGDSAQGGHAPTAAYVPAADIFAEGDDLFVRCEAAGVRWADISLTVSGGLLTVSGYRNSELDEEKIIYYTRERTYGTFRRSMLLPEGIEQDDIHASLRNGLLEIRIAGGASAKPRNIQIMDENED